LEKGLRWWGVGVFAAWGDVSMMRVQVGVGVEGGRVGMVLLRPMRGGWF
jgi:hypothetical protein